MIKVFIPEIKGKIKTSVRGLWLNDKGQLFYDYLKICKRFYSSQEDILKCLEQYKIKYNQEAIAFIDSEGLKIYYNRDKIEILPKVLRFDIGYDKANLKGLIKRLLRDYKGLTIYTEPEGYVLEVYYN